MKTENCVINLEKEFIKKNMFEGIPKDLVLDYLGVTRVDNVTKIVIKSKNENYRKWKVILIDNEGKKCVIRFRYSKDMETIYPIFTNYSEFKIGFGFSALDFKWKISLMGSRSIYSEIKDYILRWGEIDKKDKKLIEDKVNEHFEDDKITEPVWISADENKLTTEDNYWSIDVEGKGKVIEEIPIRIKYKDLIIETMYPIYEKYIAKY